MTDGKWLEETGRIFDAMSREEKEQRMQAILQSNVQAQELAFGIMFIASMIKNLNLPLDMLPYSVVLNDLDSLISNFRNNDLPGNSSN